MRVALLVTDLERGGTPLRVARLARGLTSAGVEAHVGCLAAMGPVGDALAREGVPVFACDARRPWHLGALRRLSQRLQCIQPDIVHAHLMHANVAARLVGYELGLAVLTSSATIEVERPWHRWLERFTGGLDQGHIVNHDALAEYARRRLRYPADKVHVIAPSIAPPPDRIDASAARLAFELPDDAFVLLWVGRMDPVKRVEIVIRTAAALRGENVVALLVGDGPQRAKLEALVEQLDAPVRFAGWQPDLGAALSAADLLLLPSQTEGLPNAVLEALAFGLPAATSDTPTLRTLGIRKLVHLVRDDTDRGYMTAVRYLKDHSDRLSQLAEAGRAYATPLIGSEAAAADLVKIYQAVLKRAPLNVRP